MSRMNDAVSHPEHLPWYVAGKVSENERHVIERHLLECADCRDQAEALLSLKRSLRLSEAEAHPTEQELVAFARGEQRIKAHLKACASCRQDLEALRVSDARLHSRDSHRGSQTRWALAAAMLIMVAGAGVMLLLPRPAHSSVVSLEPADRSLPGGAVMTGSGPWVVRLILPFGAPDGDYRVRLDRGEGLEEIPMARSILTATRGVI